MTSSKRNVANNLPLGSNHWSSRVVDAFVSVVFGALINLHWWGESLLLGARTLLQPTKHTYGTTRSSALKWTTEVAVQMQVAVDALFVVTATRTMRGGITMRDSVCVCVLVLLSAAFLVRFWNRTLGGATWLRFHCDRSCFGAVFISAPRHFGYFPLGGLLCHLIVGG